ncbi:MULTISPECIES: hypothetical protein [Micromonospora]|uniref:Uncharacterized protein n=1 Tax=Micromonospora solifontis TaxID=2487138 RepID=A0ABX9WCG6_9ACTN|nr:MULTISPECIES: hypothetical protein [Micromonospora]NES15755.1 hypothetical protein [Micromonospora sp. PPF5-17B]NES38239.1 hypothetical protein [Micromonospora solifontis]NES56601.1 hypothetical protein [Micromonospora sp. PPF5-6]RNL96427.1 hypothetical protein EFE23_19090 [Micromonospora solifontis]
MAADRLVTIEESLAKLMLVTPGCRPDDRALATAVLNRGQDDQDEQEEQRPAPAPAPAAKRRWWQRRG